MLSYVPAEWTKVGSNAGVKGPAYVISLTRQNTGYLVTGGDDPQAIFITGDMRGKSYRLRDISDASVVMIEDIKVEVDLASILPRSGGAYPTCCLAMTEAGAHILATTHSRFTFEDTAAWHLATGDVKEYFDGRAVFPRWRICRRDADNLIEILAVTVAPTTE